MAFLKKRAERKQLERKSNLELMAGIIAREFLYAELKTVAIRMGDSAEEMAESVEVLSSLLFLLGKDVDQGKLERCLVRLEPKTPEGKYKTTYISTGLPVVGVSVSDCQFLAAQVLDKVRGRAQFVGVMIGHDGSVNVCITH